MFNATETFGLNPFSVSMKIGIRLGITDTVFMRFLLLL